MADQVQCPNCGGFRVETTTKTIDKKTNKEFDFGCAFWFALLFFAILPTLFGASIWLAILSGTYESYPSGRVESMLVLPVGLFFLILMGLYILSYIKAEKIEKYYYACVLCGYKWSRRADEPLPSVQVRQDLIAKGAQRLEEEEEERRRAAAAAWYQQQQKKK